MKTKNLRAMYDALRLGAIVDCNGCQIYRTKGSRGYDLFFWRSFGSSANRVSLSELRFIVKKIAQSVDYSYKIIGYTN